MLSNLVDDLDRCVLVLHSHLTDSGSEVDLLCDVILSSFDLLGLHASRQLVSCPERFERNLHDSTDLLN